MHLCRRHDIRSTQTAAVSQVPQLERIIQQDDHHRRSLESVYKPIVAGERSFSQELLLAGALELYRNPNQTLSAAQLADLLLLASLRQSSLSVITAQLVLREIPKLDPRIHARLYSPDWEAMPKLLERRGYIVGEVTHWTKILVVEDADERVRNFLSKEHHKPLFVLFYLLSTEKPYDRATYNWKAITALLSLSSGLPRPLIIERQSYRAIRQILLMLPKTVTERDTASALASSWPPYRILRDGMEEKANAEDYLSRVVKAGMMMQEAGYAKQPVDDVTDILGGRAPDGSPTVQTRANYPRRIHYDQAAWAALIRTTRNSQEAWAIFKNPPEANMEPNWQVYWELIVKIAAKPADLDHNNLPGDGREVSPFDDRNLTDFEKARQGWISTKNSSRAPWESILVALARPNIMLSAVKTKTNGLEVLLLATEVMERAEAHSGLSLLMFHSENNRESQNFLSLYSLHSTPAKVPKPVSSKDRQCWKTALSPIFQKRSCDTADTPYEVMCDATRKLKSAWRALSTTGPIAKPKVNRLVTASHINNYMRTLAFVGDYEEMLLLLQWVTNEWLPAVTTALGGLSLADMERLERSVRAFRAFAEPMLGNEVVKPMHQEMAHNKALHWPSDEEVEDYIASDKWGDHQNLKAVIDMVKRLEEEEATVMMKEADNGDDSSDIEDKGEA
ncbi:hypothetical protein K4K56_012556 [Colletotrichum sp. SAR 10_98]|nr:hypothetical protein K4K56_012556 [Colletotrichum sp. SAR 10_98]